MKVLRTTTQHFAQCRSQGMSEFKLSYDVLEDIDHSDFYGQCDVPNAGDELVSQSTTTGKVA